MATPILYVLTVARWHSDCGVKSCTRALMAFRAEKVFTFWTFTEKVADFCSGDGFVFILLTYFYYI